MKVVAMQAGPSNWQSVPESALLGGQHAEPDLALAIGMPRVRS
jgi:hypothetical protein